MEFNIPRYTTIRHYRFQFGRFVIQTSSEELKQIATAWLLISVAFAILDINGDIVKLGSTEFVKYLLMAAATVGIGFLFHELSHKIVAQHYHCWAEFRADAMMLILAVGMSFFGFVFIAPGAVFIQGKVTTRQNGIISLAGPVMNVALALVFLAFGLISTPKSLFEQICFIGFGINAWLGLFNMIPFGYFDGAKVWAWRKAAYFTAVIILAILTFISFL